MRLPLLSVLTAIVLLVPTVAAIGMIVPDQLSSTQTIRIGTPSYFNITLKNDNLAKTIKVFAKSSSEVLQLNDDQNYEQSFSFGPSEQRIIQVKMKGEDTENGIIVTYGFIVPGSGDLSIDQVTQRTFKANVLCPTSGCSSSVVAPPKKTTSSGGGGNAKVAPIVSSGSDSGSESSSDDASTISEENKNVSTSVVNQDQENQIGFNTNKELPQTVPTIPGNAVKGGKLILLGALSLMIVTMILNMSAINILKGMEI